MIGLEFVQDVKGFIPNKRGKYAMVDQKGYAYDMHQRNENQKRSTWRCKRHQGSKKFEKCPARAWTVGTKIIRLVSEHNHPPNESHIREIELTPQQTDSETIGHFVAVE